MVALPLINFCWHTLRLEQYMQMFSQKVDYLRLLLVWLWDLWDYSTKIVGLMVIHDSWEACGSLFAVLKYLPKLLASVVKPGHCTGYCMYFNSYSKCTFDLFIYRINICQNSKKENCQSIQEKWHMLLHTTLSASYILWSGQAVSSTCEEIPCFVNWQKQGICPCFCFWLMVWGSMVMEESLLK